MNTFFHKQSWLYWFFFMSFCFFTIFSGVVWYVMHNHVVDFSVLENYNPGKPTILYDCHGCEWARFQKDKREFISLQAMPEHLIQAFIAAEDHTFFSHQGISIKGLIRSILVNLYKRRRAQGASTLTQQLVRLLFFNAKKTFTRKLFEQIYAILVELQCTKEQILETYLNHVYFGHGIYGVKAAAQRFWNVDVADLTIEQSAILASLMKSPVYYSPIRFPEKSKKRRDYVLGWMHALQFISTEEYEHAVEKDIVVYAQAQTESQVQAPHIKEMIRIFLEEKFGRQTLYEQGLHVQTTLDTHIQEQAHNSFTQHITKLRSTYSGIDGAVVSLDVATGEVRALVGGYDFQASKFNRATQATRQMGSIFKPFVYAAAMEKGYTFADVFCDEPITVGSGAQAWTPRNNTRTFVGDMTLARALSFSNNIITIKLFLEVGAYVVGELARRVGLPADQDPYPSLALGCIETNVMHAVAAFNVFASNGYFCKPYWIRWVKDEHGKKVYIHKPERKAVLSRSVASQVTRVLSLGMKRLQRYLGEKWFGGQALGKTGTTNDFKTCWFCGSTPKLTTAVYVGTDDNTSLGRNVYAVKTAFPIWYGLYKNLSEVTGDFYIDPNLKDVMIHWKKGTYAQKSEEHQPGVVSLLLP